jgi:hypothetical protein
MIYVKDVIIIIVKPIIIKYRLLYLK